MIVGCYAKNTHSCNSLNQNLIKVKSQKFSLYKNLCVVMLLIFTSSCSSDFERSQFVDAIYYPNGNVNLEGRTIEKIDNNYNLTISQPLHLNEIGTVYIHDFWNSQGGRRSYEKIENHGTGVISYVAAKAVIPNNGEYYIPLTLLNQTGKIEFQNRNLSLSEWVQLNPYLTFFIILGTLIIFIAWSNNKANIRRQNESEAEERRLKRLREEQEKEEYYQKLNLILTKSGEIANKILPDYEFAANKAIECAKYEFKEKAFSPFWSEIEKASKFFAYYKEALTQLCINSELYNHIILENKKYNFSLPFPFPIATNILIPKTILEEYNQTIRKAQKDPTFSIIWEQRRNSEILIVGFRTLESAIADMSNQITWAINDLNNSISSELDSIKYIQKEQLRTFESSNNYLQATLNSMDNKLYYIQWKQKPLGTFFHR